ncbi:MAG: hypothetical protein ACI87J_001562 [Colwellia sp.]|jgi:hypothetical protein
MHKCMDKKPSKSNTWLNFLPLITLGFSLFTLISVQGKEANNELGNPRMQLINPFKKEPSIMINFTEQKNADNWRITNDSVMGGKSEGRFLFEQDSGIFTGYISLENNGGFSSVFRMIEPLPKNLETVSIDVEGDGITYQLRMIVSLDGYRLAYKHNFETVAGQRETLTFTLADFQASFRGRIMTNAPVLKSEDIRQVGFLITKKVAGKFSLSVFSLHI